MDRSDLNFEKKNYSAAMKRMDFWDQLEAGRSVRM